MKKTKLMIILLIIVMTLLILTTISNAALQSNGGTLATNKNETWITLIRRMEALGGTLGLNESINSNTLLSTTGSNNLDIHMIKNTEYGAIAILSASSYGNPNVIAAGQTTTGNETGVVMNTNEWVALDTDKRNKFSEKINSRYLNIYDYPSPKSKIGDATTETQGWHGGRFTWGSDGTSYDIIRGYLGKVFAQESTQSDASAYSRAIMICGEGI